MWPRNARASSWSPSTRTGGSSSATAGLPSIRPPLDPGGAAAGGRLCGLTLRLVPLRSQPPSRVGTGPARHHRLRHRGRSRPQRSASTSCATTSAESTRPLRTVRPSNDPRYGGGLGSSPLVGYTDREVPRLEPRLEKRSGLTPRGIQAAHRLTGYRPKGVHTRQGLLYPGLMTLGQGRSSQMAVDLYAMRRISPPLEAGPAPQLGSDILCHPALNGVVRRNSGVGTELECRG